MPLEESIVGRARLGLLLLLGAIGGVVLIACANLANLSLTRALGRMRDAAVRSALGASRGRLVRGVVLEQLVLAAIGGALGLLVAREGAEPVRQDRAHRPAARQRRRASTGACWRSPRWPDDRRRPVGRAAAGVAHGTRRRAGDAARRRTRRDGSRRSARPRDAARRAGGALGHAARRHRTVRRQLRPAACASIRASRRTTSSRSRSRPSPDRYPDEKARAALYDRILASRHAICPVITSAAWTSALPLTGETWVDLIARIGDTRPSSQKPSANYRFIGPDYFRTLSMPIAKGRSIDERDRTRAVMPAVISARAAQTLWPGEDPVGRSSARGDPEPALRGRRHRRRRPPDRARGRVAADGVRARTGSTTKASRCCWYGRRRQRRRLRANCGA